MVVVTPYDLPQDYQYLPMEETAPPVAEIAALRFGRWDDRHSIPPGVLRVASRLCDDLAALRRCIPAAPHPDAASWWPRAWAHIREAHKACARYRTVMERCAPQYQQTLSDDEAPRHVCGQEVGACVQAVIRDRWGDPVPQPGTACKDVWLGRGASLLYTRRVLWRIGGDIDCTDSNGKQNNMSYGHHTLKEFERARAKAPVLKKYSYVPASDAAHVDIQGGA